MTARNNALTKMEKQFEGEIEGKISSNKDLQILKKYFEISKNMFKLRFSI